MREAISALESAVGALEQAQSGLPDDLRAELVGLLEQARLVLESLRARATEA